MNLRTFIIALALFGSIVASASDAKAKQYHFLGSHPISPKHGGGYCHIEFPHVHAYAPHKAKLLYRQHSDGYYFVGDPVAHGYEGDRYSYHGAHPIYVDEVVASIQVEAPVVEWCYIKGPHYHAHAPSAHASFEVKGDVHWYVGTYPPEFERQRRAAVQINTVYAPMVYHRPTVVVEPPSAYVDVFVAAPVISVPVAPVTIVAPVPLGPPVPVAGSVGFSFGGGFAPSHAHGHYKPHKGYKGKQKHKYGHRKKHGHKGGGKHKRKR